MTCDGCRSCATVLFLKLIWNVSFPYFLILLTQIRYDLSESCFISQADISTEIIEEVVRPAPTWRIENLVVQFPSGTMESPAVEVRIDIPSFPAYTPEKANSSPVCSPRVSSAHSSKEKSSLRNFFPKIGTRPRNITLDLDKAAIHALGAQKLSISRSASLTKLFNPKMKRSLSLPVTGTLHSNPESARGSCDIDAVDYSVRFFTY